MQIRIGGTKLGVLWVGMAAGSLFFLYGGCQNNAALFKRFFLQPPIPHFRNLKHYDENGNEEPKA
jgi:hypothetical protein